MALGPVLSFLQKGLIRITHDSFCGPPVEEGIVFDQLWSVGEGGASLVEGFEGSVGDGLLGDRP